MTTLGKCLVFYLRHATEMNRLYGVEEPKTAGLEDPARVLDMVKLVGERASQEVADFLEACTTAIETHLETICPRGWTRVRRKVEADWEIRYRIRSLGSTQTNAI